MVVQYLVEFHDGDSIIGSQLNNIGENCQRKILNPSTPFFLSIPQSGGEMSKRLGGIIVGRKDRISSWHLNGFPDGSDIGSTVSYRGETHRYIVRYTYIIN